MNPINPQLRNDFVTFGTELIASQDVDPLYPVLKWLEKDMDEEQALWFTFLYMTYYNIASAVKAFRIHPHPTLPHPEVNTFPCATERRNLRGGKALTHIADYVRRTRVDGSQRAFLQQGWGSWGDDPVRNYEMFWETAQSLWNNGRWAAFKWSEILKKVHGWNLAAPDMRMEFCSGPKAGLMDMFGLQPGDVLAGESGIWQLNYYGTELRRECAQNGLFVEDWETLETVLCNFHSLREGRYYIGHDIDELQHVIEHSDLYAVDKQWLYDARRAVLPNEYLGEFHAWEGVDKLYKKTYQLYEDIVRRFPNPAGNNFVTVLAWR